MTPQLCYSNRHFAEQFSGTMKRVMKRTGREYLTGYIIRREGDDLHVVQWEELKTPQKLHRSFLTIPKGSRP